ncbi:hypothetical protein F2Q70_00031905 [Brassica cretica]|uniref:Uncharacterized protein n=1 Tax=Brassica cretica TaxID=69181 RepID=A0A8S9FEK0_BRACR|nr:hypothetical protein F2Q70_00031905 [Brassica cretica]
MNILGSDGDSPYDGGGGGSGGGREVYGKWKREDIGFSGAGVIVFSGERESFLDRVREKREIL